MWRALAYSPPTDVVVFKLVYGLGYIKFETPQGTIRFSLQQPTINPTTGKIGCDPLDATCNDDFTDLSKLDYCLQKSSGASRGFTNYNCTFWDEIMSKEVTQSSIMIST